ncbi:hypothetical protein JTE90_011702 [Oedothorax gibbosus]|uniref:Caveolin n=1 Tax=Oedothorax gibbosus TaxID=931172 RepID=A0AAV6UV17_9ARAC|nr:hypothetical protein JTE90_011702 [Oedothorax gibbosus]
MPSTKLGPPLHASSKSVLGAVYRSNSIGCVASFSECRRTRLTKQQLTRSSSHLEQKNSSHLIMDRQDKSSLKGSQTIVGESVQPLIEGATQLGGEEVEIQLRSSAQELGSTKDGEQKRSPLSCMDSFTVNMNLLDRDTQHINDHMNVLFEEVLAEPRAHHSFDPVWRLAYVTFAGTKLWVYRVLAGAFAVPCGLIWGLVFSLLALAGVWIIGPAVKLIEVLIQVVVRVWGGLARAILDPVFQSASLLVRGRQTLAQESI